MARVLAISSQVVFGPVGNTAAVPALQALGHEVMQVPTVLLSHHPGHGKPEGQATPSGLLERLFESAADAGAFDQCDAVMTGYFASAAQVEIVARLLPRIGAKTVLVDPVIGDHGRLYVAGDTAAAIRDHLVPQAHILTPNLFELGWLTRTTPASEQDAIAAARSLPCGLTLATSVPSPRADEIATVLITRDQAIRSAAIRRPDVPHGTGDFLAGLFLGAYLQRGAETALHEAMHILNRAIALSAGSKVLKVAEALQRVMN